MSTEQPYYLCIDDESGDRLEPVLERLRRGGVNVRLTAPDPFDKEVAAIRASDAAGLLLDLRLDDMPGTKGRVQYHALSLAQELRTRMTEGDLRSLPIVLWSIERKFRKSYSNDTTAHDLFDLVISKTQVSGNARSIARKLIALATDYPLLSAKTKTTLFWGRILGLEASARDRLDPRIGAELRANAPAHQFARYVIRELFSRPGPLVDEALLSARLGVNLTSADWAAAKLQLESTRYKGVFSSGWVRWWWPAVESVLRQLAPATPFRAIAASDRVDILKKQWALDRLEPVEATEGSASRFWYICAATDEPLDPVDAVAAESGERKPWQEALYISIDAALSRRAAAKGIRVHPLEEARLAEMTDK